MLHKWPFRVPLSCCCNCLWRQHRNPIGELFYYDDLIRFFTFFFLVLEYNYIVLPVTTCISNKFLIPCGIHVYHTIFFILRFLQSCSAIHFLRFLLKGKYFATFYSKYFIYYIELICIYLTYN